MNIFKLYLNESDKIFTKGDLKFNFKNDILKVKFNDISKEFNNFKENDIVMIKCEDSIEAVLCKYPKNKGQMLGWLMGFNRKHRCLLQNDYKEILKENSKKSDKIDTIKKDNKWILSVANLENSKIKPIACWVSDKLNKEEIIELLKEYKTINGIYYPVKYIKNFLYDNLKIKLTEDEIKTQIKH